jgi:hypothetical protein
LCGENVVGFTNKEEKGNVLQKVKKMQKTIILRGKKLYTFWWNCGGKINPISIFPDIGNDIKFV